MLFVGVTFPYIVPLAVFPVAFFMFFYGMLTGRNVWLQVLLLVVVVVSGYLVFCQANCAWELVWTNRSATCDCDALLEQLVK